jgi:hypothetical protein
LSYGFADVEAALAQVHHIADPKRSAFANRLKHLQRLGFPEGVNTGRGRAATYLPEHVFLIAVALQLNEFGITPERAIKLISNSMGRIADGVMQAIDPDPLAVDRPIYCHVPAAHLEDLSIEKPSDWSLGCHPAQRTIDTIIDASKRPNMVFRLAVFSLSGLLIWLPDLLSPHDEHARRQFLISMREWGTPLSEQYFVERLRPKSPEHLIDAFRQMKRDGREDLAERYATEQGYEAEWRSVLGESDG